MKSVGALALGSYLPPDVRCNDWWPNELVDRWRVAMNGPALQAASKLTEGEARVLRGAARFRGDPFHGVVERRVLAPELGPLDAAEQAARDALHRAALDPAEVDLLLAHNVVADHALFNSACALHERLGLAPACLALDTEATGYTALAQIAIAEAMIASGRARYALLVQTSVCTRLIDRDDPGSPILGDGASAIAMGEVAAGHGVLGIASFTEGKYPLSLILSVPGGRWYDGDPRIYVGDRDQMAAAQLRTADSCEQAVRVALQQAKLGLGDVDHLCVGQGTAWLHDVVAEQLGLENLPKSDVFSRFGYLASAHVPSALFEAQRNNQLADNHIVAIVAGGTGMTYGAVVMRWGRR